MKKLVKIFCILLIAGFALTFIGVLSGGHAHVAYWDGRLHTLREVLHRSADALDRWTDRVSHRLDHLLDPDIDDWLDFDDPLPGPHDTAAVPAPTPAAPEAPLPEAPVAQAPDALAKGVKKLEFHLAGGNYQLVPSSETFYTVECADSIDLTSDFTPTGTWEIRTLPSLPQDSTITIFLPENHHYEEIEIETGAASIDLGTLQADEIELKIGAAYAQAAALTCRDLSVSVGGGKLSCSLIDADAVDAEIGAGALIGTLSGSAANYRYEAKAGAGSITLDDTALADGLYAKTSGGTGDRYLDLKVGLGSISLACTA